MTEVILTREDGQLRGTATGAGPTVLLLHAGGERRDVWAPIAAVLNRRNLRTVAFDLRGHGASTGQATDLATIAADVAAMIRHEPAPVVVVGASLGGLAAITALADPRTAHDVAGLILVDVVPQPDPVRARVWLDEHGLTDVHTELVDDILGRARSATADALASTPDHRDPACCDRGEIGCLAVPILLVRAGPDSPLADDDIERFRTTHPGITVTHVPAAGHLIARDAPDDLARIIGDHASMWLEQPKVN
ncbi:alpha/beta hydrolase [Kribbella sp. NPDC005582]|uniref:alpha/beta fold hydrolase n=1 Tax=Kribbella sp. NPDC005582 TaxID=3156893 RepID=UPI0033A8408C